MPSGHVSQGTSDKPNTNTTGQMDIAADTVAPGIFFLKELPPTTRTQEFVDYPPATQRPGMNPSPGGKRSREEGMMRVGYKEFYPLLPCYPSAAVTKQ